MYNPSVRVHLIDTPGFDDTNLSDVQVLQNIAHWLSASFKSGVRLNGIIFMHRISDPRLAGSAKRNLLMFKKLCGEKVYQSVVLATTMWGKVTPEEGDRREKELINEPTYWGSMYKLGSKVFRYHNTRESALDLISYIISLHRSVTLDIQDEIVNKHREIDETSAAHQLNAEIIKERKKHQAALHDMQEQMAEAIAERDEVLQQEFKEEIDALQAKISKGDEEQVKLRQTLEEVDKRKEAEFKAFKEQMRRERQEEQRRFEAERAEFNSRFAMQEKNMRKHQQRDIERMAQEKANRDEMAQKQEEYQRRAQERRLEQQRQMREIEERYERREQERVEEVAQRRNSKCFHKLSSRGECPWAAANFHVGQNPSSTSWVISLMTFSANVAVLMLLS